MPDPVFTPKQLKIPDGWTVIKNEFVDLEPDNNYPVDEVFYHFDEDILYATYGDYSVDLGFYGGYLENNRSGFFKVVVFRGDFNDGEFFECFISRSTDKIQDKLNSYFKAIPEGQLDNLFGVKYDDNYDHRNFHIYSVTDKVDFRLSVEELEEVAKAK